MSKKAVIILSVLAIALAAGSGVLFYLINGKVEASITALKPVDEFADKSKLAEHPLEARLGAPTKAASELGKVRGDNVAKQADIDSKTTKIGGLERTVRERDTSIEGLETKNTQLTRERDDVQNKVAGLSTDLTSAKAKVSELETTVAKQTEDFNKKAEELEKKVSSEKGDLYGELEKTRQYYAQVYNYSTSHGLKLPLPIEPWNGVQKSSGPMFAPKTFVAQVIGFDARQGLVVVNVGPESGLLRDQTFDLIVAGKSVGKVSVSSSPNGSVSALSFSAASGISNIPVGTPVKLQAYSGDEPAPAVIAAPAPAPAAPAEAKK